MHADAQPQVSPPQFAWVSVPPPEHDVVGFGVGFGVGLVFEEQTPFEVHPELLGLLLQQTSVRPPLPRGQHHPTELQYRYPLEHVCAYAAPGIAAANAIHTTNANAPTNAPRHDVRLPPE